MDIIEFKEEKTRMQEKLKRKLGGMAVTVTLNLPVSILLPFRSELLWNLNQFLFFPIMNHLNN